MILPSPKFNIVAQPNEWSRTIEESARSGETSELTETRQLQLMLDSISATAQVPGNPDIHLRRQMRNLDGVLYQAILVYAGDVLQYATQPNRLIADHLRSQAKPKYKGPRPSAPRSRMPVLSSPGWSYQIGKSVIKLTRQATDPENRNAWGVKQLAG
ncbi:MAG: hypothetical protein IPO29_04805 [Anaerolineae bacterium]|nr:hypothetical protein [Anaerolineae bacterium]